MFEIVLRISFLKFKCSLAGEGGYFDGLLSVDEGDSFPGLKRHGRETDHSPSSSAKVENVWSYSSTPTIWNKII
jgi:hypothetical protein